MYARHWYTDELHRALLEEGGYAEPGVRAEALVPVVSRATGILGCGVVVSARGRGGITRVCWPEHPME